VSSNSEFGIQNEEANSAATLKTLAPQAAGNFDYIGGLDVQQGTAYNKAGRATTFRRPYPMPIASRTPAHQVIYDRLISAARQRSRMFHSEVRAILESLPGDPQARPDVDQVLTDIAAAEHRAGRPLLTALVVTGKSIPGNIFFASARDLGVLSSADPAEEMRFWMAEEARVYDAWGQ
jgi:hypothetical protein